MDPSLLKTVGEVVGPFLAILTCGAIPVSLVFISKHFKLRTRELELEAELHGRASQARLQALETRLAAMEGAIGSIAQGLGHRQELPQDQPEVARLVASERG